MKKPVTAMLGFCLLAAASTAQASRAMSIVRELSGPAYGGRQAGSPGGVKAGAYLKALLEKSGMNVTTIEFRERVPVYVRKPRFSLGMPGGKAVELVFRKDYRDVTNGAWVEERARGPLVVLDNARSPFPRGSIVVVPGQGYDNADDSRFLEAGAVGLLVVLDAASAERRATYPGQAPMTMAAPRKGLVKMVVSESVMPLIREASAKGGIATLENPLGFADRNCRDYLATWNGDGGGFEPGLMFMAHYDHVGTDVDGSCFPGALDNASGTGLLVALAQRFVRDGYGSDVAFLLTDSEEINLSGASAFARKSPFGLGGIDSINLDMVGSANHTPLTIYSNGDSASTELGAGLMKALAAAGIGSSQRYPVPNVDSGPLGRAGAASVTLCEDDLATYHTKRDTADNVSEKSLAALEGAIYVFATGRRR